MDKKNISIITGIDENSIDQSIIERIDDIESSEFQYAETSVVNLSTRKATVGSFGYFNENDYDKIKGEDLTVMTFEDENRQKRYCIVDSDHQLVKKSLSALKSYSEYCRSLPVMKDIEYAEKLSEVFQDLGMNLSGKEIFHCCEKLSEMDIYVFNPDNRSLEDMREDIEESLLYFQEHPEEKVEDIILEYKENIINLPDTTKNIDFEWRECGKDRQSDMNRTMCQFIREGGNSSEENYITKVTRKMGQQILEQMMKNDYIVSADRAQLFEMDEKAFEQIKQMVAENPQKAEEYLRFYTAENNIEQKRVMHSSIIKELADMMRTNPDAIIPKRVNHDLQVLANHVLRSCKNFEIPNTQTQKAVANMIKQYVTSEDIHYLDLDEFTHVNYFNPGIHGMQRTYNIIQDLIDDKPLGASIKENRLSDETIDSIKEKGLSEKTKELYLKTAEKHIEDRGLSSLEESVENASGYWGFPDKVDTVWENDRIKDITITVFDSKLQISEDMINQINAELEEIEKESTEEKESIEDKGDIIPEAEYDEQDWGYR